MSRKLKRVLVLAMASVALMGPVPAVAEVSAPTPRPINEVPCDRDDYLKIEIHRPNGGDVNRCYANGGEADIDSTWIWWLTKIRTGNNRVQWFGDGKWQPEKPIGKHTVFTFPNHPGGVKIDKIRIV